MKILIFAGYFYPHKGGVEDYVLNLSKRLIKKGHKITVACPNTEGTKHVDNLDKIKIIRFPSINLLSVYPLIYSKKRILETLEKEKFDLIITNTRFFHTSLIGKNFVKKNKIPWIHVEHGTSLVQTNNPLIWTGSRIFDFTFGKKILNDANKIVAISNEAKLFIEKISKNRNILVIHNGINLQNIIKYKQKKHVKNITSVGRLIYAKGMQDLIQAFYMIKNKSLTLTIIGNGPYKEKLEMLVRNKNLQKKVNFLGEKEHKDVIKTLSKGDLFINPSYSEGLPTTVLEAGAVGLPVIATNVGGTKEVIINKKTGILIEPKNTTQLKDAIKIMINDKKKRGAYSKNLNKLVETKFNWEKIIKQWEEILKKIKN